MEEHVLTLLASTQLPDDAPRKDAEYQLEQLYTNDQFPSALVSIASHNLVPTNNRQAALNVLKIIVQRSWSASLLGFEGGTGQSPINDVTKEQIRRALYAIIVDDNADSKVTSAASAVVSKIAGVDFPEAWPDLLTNLLAQVQRSSDGQLHGVLVVLVELIQDALDETVYAANAKDLLTALYSIAIDDARKFSLRALAVLVFRSCFDTLEMMKQENKPLARQLTQDALDMWLPFLYEYLRLPMPTLPTKADEEEATQIVMHWRGVIMLKIRVISVLGKIQQLFPMLLGSHACDLFIATWNALQAHAPIYRALYTETDDRQGKLTDSNNLQYTFDFLALEELDYLQGLLNAPQVKRTLMSELDSAGDVDSNDKTTWVVQVISKLVDYACVTAEDEAMWEMDINIFLVEETSATENYTHRSACANFVRKLGNWIPQHTMSSLLVYMKTIFADGSSDWRIKEAVLFLLQQVLEELYCDPQVAVADHSFVFACLEYIRAILSDSNDLLRGRGHIVASAITTSSGKTLIDVATDFAQHCIRACKEDTSEVVKLSCIRAMQDYLRSIPRAQVLDLQVQSIDAISRVLDSQDLDDLSTNEELTATLVETLREAIAADPAASLQHNALTVLFTIIKYSASSLFTSELAEEAFGVIVTAMANEGQKSYLELCGSTIPTLMGALDLAGMTSKEDLGLVAMSMLAQLTESAPEGLPEGFVSIVMPKICRILFNDNASELHEKATVIIQLMLSHDHNQVFSWRDPEIGKGGLEMVLLIIQRLLGPQVDDTSAAEVGSLAVELVEKANADDLRPLMPGLLNVAASRLSTAQHEPLIQSLALIFAHLALVDAQQMLDFLASIQVGGQDRGSGLDIVLRKWLESSIYFAGAKNIRKNIMALASIYKLYDARLAEISVQGDLIVENTSRIKTRSMAKREPDKYQTIALQLKLLKVLIAEIPPDLSPFTAPQKYGKAEATSPEKDSDDEEDEEDWEDDNDFLDLAATGMREELMSEKFVTHFSRDYNKDTQDLLLEFFRGIAPDPEFRAQCTLLNDIEKQKLEALERVAQAQDQFRLDTVQNA